MFLGIGLVWWIIICVIVFGGIWWIAGGVTDFMLDEIQRKAGEKRINIKVKIRKR